jgi:hypothetical protein
MANKMFPNARTNFVSTPTFKTEIMDIQANQSYKGKGRATLIQVWSRINDLSNWELEYSKEYPINYESLDYKVKVIQNIIKENYFYFRKGEFTDIVMFSLNGVMYKVLELEYANKVIWGQVIDQELLYYLPIKLTQSFDIIDNKGGLRFYKQNEVVIRELADDNCRVFLNGKKVLVYHAHSKLTEEYIKEVLEGEYEGDLTFTYVPLGNK